MSGVRSIKNLVRTAVANIASGAGWLAAAERAAADDLTILCYHRVLPAAQRAAYHDPALVVTPETFRAHCEGLKARYDVRPLGEAFGLWRARTQTARPLLAITFDDGYRDNLRHAAPILDAFGLKATFFIVAGLVDTDERPWYDRAGEAWLRRAAAGETMDAPDVKTAIGAAKQLSPADRSAWVNDLARGLGAATPHDDDLIMTGAHVAALAAAGHEIGSHSMTHPLLPQCRPEELSQEISRSRTRLQEIARQEIGGFCYPNGDSDPAVRACVERSGYAYATSTISGLNRRDDAGAYQLKRWFIDEDRLSAGDGRPSAALLRMETTGLSQRIFRRKAA